LPVEKRKVEAAEAVAQTGLPLPENEPNGQKKEW
jgi:hypothetical protein